MSDIIETWRHEPDRPELRAFALAKHGRVTVDLNDVDTDWTHAHHGVRLDMLICRSIAPHVDNWHPEWSALWVLQAGPGHALHIADRRSGGDTKIRKPAKAVTLTAPLTVGCVVLFNGHRVHWLPEAADQSALIVANFDFEKRPTREEIAVKIDRAAMELAAAQARALAA